MLLGEIGEFGLIARIREIVARQRGDVVLGIDDDTAAVRVGSEVLLLTTDALIENVHFRFDYFEPSEVGWRLMAANLSDVAAMGGTPLFALVALALPKTIPVEHVKGIYAGAVDLADRFGVAIVGGDTTGSPRDGFLSLTLVARAPDGCFARRDRARPGDVLAVTGHLGGAQAGLNVLLGRGELDSASFPAVVERHKRPWPRVDEGKFLVHEMGVDCVIDVSDGLASEVGHLCRLSGTGARVEAERVPLHPETVRVAEHLGEDPLDYALHGGEDFELLFCVPAERWDALAAAWRERFETPLTRVGQIVDPAEGLTLVSPDGTQALTPRGWDHFRHES